MNEPCRFLPWDSEFFGLRIARAESSRLDKSSKTGIDQWCKQNNIDCLYFLADPDYTDTTRIAENNGFHLVDIRVTMHHQHLSAQPTDRSTSLIATRPFQSSDVPELRAIARKSFTLSRFYSDPCFPREKCEGLYDIWIKNSCEGYADQVLVADINSLPQGFITCHIRQDGQEGDIGLIGVREQARGQGVGISLVAAALRWFSDQVINHVFVVTQGGNMPAHRLYERAGFSIHSLQLWYHKWFKGCKPD
jgi:dTDP-4-amino-4,6-dideoxy-D-galactose acyltransferase